MNEKRNIELALDPDSPETRTRSDVAPKQTHASGASARHISGLRPAVHLPASPSVPPAPLTPADLLEDGWDDAEEDCGPTLLDSQGSVPRELVAEVRALHDPLGEREPETREVSTREVETRAFSRDEAPTGEMPTVLNALPPPPPDADVADVEDVEEEEEEFSHDDFPTRQTPMGLQEALRAFPLPSDSHRGLHETMPLADNDSTPDLPSTPSFNESLGPTVARPVAPISPRSPRAISLPSPVPMAMPTSPDETAQMPNRPALMSPLPPSVEPSSISQISQLSHVSQPPYPASTPRGVMYPTPTSISGAPLLPANTVRHAFLKNVAPNNDPPAGKLLVVAAISFFATLALSSFIAWVVVLVRH